MNTTTLHDARRPRLSLLRRPLALALLALGLSSPAALAGDDDVIHLQFLNNTGVAPAAKAKARLRFKDDSTDFKVEVEQIASGPYELLVGGVPRGTIQVGVHEGEIEFENPKDGGKPLLDFKVKGQSIEVRRDGVVYFSDVFGGNGGGGGGGGGGGVPGAQSFKFELFMANLGVDPDARGRLRYEQRPDRKRFKVNLKRLRAGDYDLVVGGTPVAVIPVSGPFEVEVAFAAPPQADEVLLDFDPLAQQVGIAQGGVSFLTAQMPGAPAATGAPVKKKHARDLGHKQADELGLALFAQTNLGAARAEARVSTSAGATGLAVAVDGLQVPAVQVVVGGAPRGTLLTDGAGDGLLVFRTQPGPGEELLDFALAGEPLELRVAGTTLFARTLPRSLNEALGKRLVDKQKQKSLKRSLVTTGVDLDARAVLRLRSYPTGEVLRLRLRDVDPGVYRLLLSGLEVAETVVPEKGSGGVFHVDTRKVPGGLPETFELVEVRRGDEVLLVAEMPEG